MQHHVQPTRLPSPPRAGVLIAVTLASGVLGAGCGTSAAGTAASTAIGAATTVSAAAGSTSTASHGSGPLAFAECMRANGVPNFPDPNPAPGALFNTAGIDTSAPAFLAASAKCHRLTGGGPPIPGSMTHPSEQTLLKLRKIAVCMRAHGVPQFPDPRTSIPSNLSPGEYQEITNFDGVILLFPASMNLQAPAYKQALAICGAPPLGLPH